MAPIPRDNEADDSSVANPARIPVSLAGITLGRVLGSGGMGRVYFGHHPGLDIDVAIKVMHRGRGHEARFLSEARLAARMQHDRIVRIIHAGEEDGHRFLVLEYVDGRTLKQVVEERGPLPWREALALAQQAAEGLAVAHSHGIVHRDVKPSNFLLDGRGRIKLADLGVARNMLAASDLTLAGDLVGTLAYMAPEQIQDAQRVTPAADIFALGGTIGYLLTGMTPKVLHKAGGLRLTVPGLPAPVEDLVRRMQARDAWDRPADGAAVVRELDALLGQVTTSTASPVSTTIERRLGGSRRRWLAAAAGVAALALAGWSAVPADDPREGDAPPPVPVPHPAPAAAPLPADPWQTPPRAVFVLGDGLPAAARAAIDGACVASGLPLIDRQHIDALLREQALVSSGRIDVATAGRLGRLIGGHVALFVAAVDGLIEVRAVVVETGEIAAARLVPPAEAETAATACLRQAVVLLPQQGRVVRDGAVLRVSLGLRHGVRVGDRLELRRSADGPAVATAQVAAVEAGRATLAAEAGDVAGTLALRSTP